MVCVAFTPGLSQIDRNPIGHARNNIKKNGSTTNKIVNYMTTYFIKKSIGNRSSPPKAIPSVFIFYTKDYNFDLYLCTEPCLVQYVSRSINGTLGYIDGTPKIIKKETSNNTWKVEKKLD